ncbi:hypothetical protein [Micromonospora sp. NBC_01813]|uniref:hypothetical protein n=1 Tax=Micromonospora sp. NBC_01813 TaxID=2975988 RepID=UPI002DDAB951|nr:hypothetical protein [Micromonospora sp. NBC_01813]WSA08583.1 hypothetical protein OG958_31135 [Micromonospora sp. NBC_01813]
MTVPDRADGGDGPAPVADEHDTDLDAVDLDDLTGYGEFDDDPTDGDDHHDGSGPAVAVAHNDGQVAHTVYGGLHQYVQRVRDYHELSDDYVQDRLDGFVDPGYHGVAGTPLDSDAVLSLMRRHGGVILVGAPDTGRYTAALRLLHATGQRLREIRPTFDPGRQEQLTVAELPVAPGFAYLLELPEQPQHIQYGFARDLGAYCDSLARRGSSIAIVATEATWTQLGAVRDGPVVRVGTPPAGQVFDRRLRRLCPGVELGWLVTQPQVAELLVDAPPAEAVRLAQLCADVLAMGGALTGHQVTITADSPIGKDVVSALVSAYHNWEAELTSWFHLHADARQRTFLVAAAALEGSHAGRVLGAAEALDLRLTATEDPVGLRHAGVRALVTDVDAYLDADGAVRFRRAWYAEAVLDFVITDRADTFQRELWSWVCDLPLRNSAGRGVVDRRLAARSAELVLGTALRRRTPEILGQVAPVWSRRVDLRGALVHVLGIAALSPEIGAAVRQRLYRWAQVRNQPKVLVTVAEVCGGQLADFYVEQAMTRLGHLARHGIAEVDEAVLAALRSLWSRPALRQPVLLRLAAWLAGAQPRGVALAAVALDLLGQPDAQPDAEADAQPDGEADAQPDGEADRRPDAEPDRRPDQVLAEVIGATAATQDDIGVALGRALDHRQLPVGVPAMLFRWFDDAAADPELVGTLTHVLGRTVTAGPAAARRVARLRTLLAQWPAAGASVGASTAGDTVGGSEAFHRHDAARRAALRRHLIHQLHRADPMTARRNSRPSQEP